MTVLPDYEIEKECIKGYKPLVSPYRSENLQPASLDVTLHNSFRCFFKDPKHQAIDLNEPETIKDITFPYKNDFIILRPGEFILGCTEEVVDIPANMVARIEGKSSLGRLGLVIHATAGFIDPGFNGRVTLEIASFLDRPIILHAGNTIAQISFEEMKNSASFPYTGRYQGDTDVRESRYTG